MTTPANILIVDDKAANRNVLHDLILALGHTPILAENGLIALERIQKQAPDLVLLDILMPGMNGYDVLGQVKSSSSYRHLPIIMISAVDEMESVVRCVKMGADDYLVKPFNPTLLKARVAACLEKKRLLDQEEIYRQQIEDYNQNLEARVSEKTKELADAYEKLKILDHAKTDFLKLISHELRTPLNGVVGISEVLFNDNLDDKSRHKFQELFKMSLDRLLEIIKQALLLTQIEVSSEMFPQQLNMLSAIFKSAVETATPFAESRQVRMSPIPSCEVQTLCDKNLMTDALVALLKTAIKFSNQNQTIHLYCTQNNDDIVIKIEADGWSIPDTFLSRFFEVFSIGDSITPGGDIGLGPPVAEHIITLYKGQVRVENREPPGIIFTVKLKVAQAIQQEESQELTEQT